MIYHVTGNAIPKFTTVLVNHSCSMVRITLSSMSGLGCSFEEESRTRLQHVVNLQACSNISLSFHVKKGFSFDFCCSFRAVTRAKQCWAHWQCGEIMICLICAFKDALHSIVRNFLKVLAGNARIHGRMV